MTLGADDLRGLAAQAITAATEAGELIARSRPADAQVQYKGGGLSLASQVVTEVDRRSQERILEVLRPTLGRFDLGLLAEEDEDDGGRRSHPFFWCVDPLDGTLCFVESTPGYAVSIALVSAEGVPQLGVVYDPVAGTLYHAVRGQGLYRDQQPWMSHAPDAGSLSLFMDRSAQGRPEYDEVIAKLREAGSALGFESVTVQAQYQGGAVMNACRTLAHPPAAYFKFPKASPGGGSLWDFAATACLFAEAGAVATDIHGDPLDLNRADSTFMNHRGVLFATDDGLAARIRQLAARICAGTAS